VNPRHERCVAGTLWRFAFSKHGGRQAIFSLFPLLACLCSVGTRQKDLAPSNLVQPSDQGTPKPVKLPDNFYLKLGTCWNVLCGHMLSHTKKKYEIQLTSHS
jgi:hypothetical protein